MTDYISREAAIEAFDDPSVERYYGDVDPESVIRVIERIPAANVRPVVFCKDCRNDCHCMIQDFMEDDGITPDDQNNFFCGYGEKEES